MTGDFPTVSIEIIPHVFAFVVLPLFVWDICEKELSKSCVIEVRSDLSTAEMC